MKITVYTITDCQFSKQEKDYLNANKLVFEEKNLETNREFLTEMLAVSNNFAGTPVTKVEKDDGQIAVLKGFTKEEFDKTLNLEAKAPPAPETAAPVAPPAPTTEPQVVESPVTPPVPVIVTEPKVETPAPVAEAPVAPPAAAPVTATAAPAAPSQPDPMADILNSLQQQANAAAATPPPVPAETLGAPAAPGMPSIPDPKL